MAYYSSADSGNYFVANYGRNPAVNFNFMLRVEALFDLPCRAVRVFHRKNEYEKIQEGGLNDYVHLRRKPISEPFTFEVERYVGTDLLDPLALGTDLALPIILYVSQYGVYNGPFLPIRMYTFTGCTVMAKEYGELNAEKSGLLVETTTIGYREMLCVENIAASWLQSSTWDFATKSGSQRAKHPVNDNARPAQHQWKFKTETVKNRDGREITRIITKGDGDQRAVRPTDDDKRAKVSLWEFDGTKKGDGTQRAQDPLKDRDHSLEDAQKEAAEKLWKFDGSSTGQGRQSAKHPENDEERAEVKVWPPKRSAVDIANFLSGKK